jgi:hypothetical protein
MGIAPGLEGSSIQQNLVELGSARYEDITSQVAQPHPSVRINPHVSCQCECVCLFSRAMRVCVMAKLSGMLGLVGFGRAQWKNWSATRVVGTSSPRVPGSCRMGRGVSHWRGVRWMSCIESFLDRRASQGYKRELRAPGLATTGNGNSCVLEFSYLSSTSNHSSTSYAIVRSQSQQLVSEPCLRILGEEIMVGGSVTPPCERPRSPSPIPFRSHHSG